MHRLSGDQRLRLPEELPAIYWLQHWRSARRNWKTLAAFALAGAVAGLLISACQTPLYHAAASIEVQGITDNVLKAQDGNPNAGADAELMDLQTQIRIMQSGSLIEQALRRAGAATGSRPVAIQRAANSLNIHVAGQTRIIELSSDSTDPRVAAAFVNALAETFIDQHVEARWQGTQRGAEKLRLALEEMRTRLEKSEVAAQVYARDSGLPTSADRASAGEEKLHQLQSELSQAQAERTARQARFDALFRGAEADLPSIVNDPAIQDAQAKLTDLRRQLADLGTTYTADYSKVKRIQAQIAPLEIAIGKEVAGTKARAHSDFIEAKHREELLNAAYQMQAQAVGIEAEKKVHYDALRREVDSTRSLYDTMLARVKEAAIASTMRASNVRVLDAARPPDAPFQPRRSRLALLGSLAGLFLGAGCVVAREQTDSAIRSAGILGPLLDATEFPAIPGSDSSGQVREAFRSLAASLLLAEGAALRRAVVISSAAAGEGKTTVATHLSGALAAAGRRVLLVDGDLRSPHLHHAFGTENETGLTDLLASGRPLTDAQIAETLQPTNKPRTMLLCAGAAGVESPDLLHSPKLAELLVYGRKNFDIVLIDSPPMGQMPDARVLARAADAVLLVVRANKTAREAVLAVRQRLFEDKTPMLGCLLNNWTPKSSRTNHGKASPLPVAEPSSLSDFLPAES